MALSASAVSELLDVLRTGQAVDLTRESVQMVLQELIETEATDVIGAARYVRTDTRSPQRLPAADAGDAGRRHRPAQSEARAGARSSADPRAVYVYLDATHLHVCDSISQVVSVAMVVATGITAD